MFKRNRTDAGPEFEVKMPGSDSFVNFNELKPSRKQYSTLQKAGIATGIAALLTGLALWVTKPSSSHCDSDYWESMYSINIPETANAKSSLNDSIKSISLMDTTYLVMHHDDFLKTLARSRSFINTDSLTIDLDTMRATRHAYEQIGLDNLVEAGNLGGMFYFLTDGGTGNTSKAMVDAWNIKKEKLQTRYGHTLDSFVDKKIKKYSGKPTESSSLQELKDFLDYETGTFKNKFNYENFIFDNCFNSKDSSQTKRNVQVHKLLDNFYEIINSGVLFAYGQTEFFGKTNPVLNLVTMDNILKKDANFIWDYPALADSYNSYGYPQNTSYVVNDNENSPLSLNKYLPKDMQVPTDMKDFATPEHHVTASLLNLVYNSLVFANKLANEDELTNFNNLLDKMSEERKRALVSGILSGMNYKPADVAQGVANYIDQIDRGNVKAENILTGLWLGGATDYYNQCVVNYITISNWDWRKCD